MRLLSIIALSTILSAPAFAADLGTYRPGTPYQSVVAPGADVCESHCSGDAQCRGWNYVKANPQAPGVCEFISSVSAPVQSAISISGVNGASDPHAGRVAQGRTNTVRVGTTAAPQTAPRSTQQGQRRVVRQPVPQQIRPQGTAVRMPSAGGESLTAQQNRYRNASQNRAPAAQQRQQFRDPRITSQNPQQRPQTQPQRRAPQFRPMLDAGSAAPQMQRQQTQRPQAPRPQVPQGYGAPQGYRAPQQMQQRQAPPRREAARRRDTRPPIGQPIAQPRAAAAPPQMPPQMPQQSAQPMPRRAASAQMERRPASPARASQDPRYLAQGLTAEQAQQSLFGKLNDDVRGPAVMTAPPANPDAPIATSAARPTVPVGQEPLGELAGAPRR